MPDWLPLVQVADRFHCPPWELVEQRVEWLQVGLALLEGESILSAHRNRPKAGAPAGGKGVIGRA